MNEFADKRRSGSFVRGGARLRSFFITAVPHGGMLVTARNAAGVFVIFSGTGGPMPSARNLAHIGLDVGSTTVKVVIFNTEA